MTALPPRETRVAALARELAPLLRDPESAPALADRLDDLVAAAFGSERPGATGSPPAAGSALADLLRAHAVAFAPLLRPPPDPDALTLAASLGHVAAWRRFREPRAITPDEAAAWGRLDAALAPVAANLDARLRGESVKGS